MAIFRLSARTRAGIEKDGLAFFATAIEGRAANRSYVRWRETPAAGRSLEHTELASILLGLGCADAARGLQKTIAQAMLTPGSYYTATHEAALPVIPAQRLVVFGYFG